MKRGVGYGGPRCVGIDFSFAVLEDMVLLISYGVVTSLSQ